MRLVHKMQFLAAIPLLFVAAIAHAANFEMTPVVQAELDKWKTVIAEWAVDPTIVKADQRAGANRQKHIARR